MDYSAHIEFENEDGGEFEDVIVGPTEDAVREDVEVYTAEVIGCGGRIHSISWCFPTVYGCGPGETVVEQF